MFDKVKVGDLISFYTSCNADRTKFSGVVEFDENLGLVVKVNNQAIVDNTQVFELRKLVDVDILESGKQCPVCNRNNTRADFDSPDTMCCCDDCGADYLTDGMEVVLDPRDSLSPEEIKQRGYNPL